MHIHRHTYIHNSAYVRMGAGHVMYMYLWLYFPASSLQLLHWSGFVTSVVLYTTAKKEQYMYIHSIYTYMCMRNA